MSPARARFRLPAATSTLAVTAVLGGSALLGSPGTTSAAASPATTPVTAEIPVTVASDAPLLQVRLASATTSAATSTSSAAAALVRAQAVLVTAASLKGRPYRYGAAGPNAFDCSGYAQYVFKRNGITLPRTAQQQYRKATKISKSSIRVGDLVFFVSHGYAYHVGIYAGNGMMWHAPHTGSTVRLVKISSSSWVAGRIIN